MPVVRGEVTKRSKDMFFGYRRLVKGIDGQGLIRGDWKLLQEAKSIPRVRLYDLASDSYEQKDLASEMPDLLKSMKQAMEKVDQSCQLSRDGADYRY